MIEYWTGKKATHTAAIERLRAERDISEGEIKEACKRGLVFHSGELRIANTAVENFK